MSCVTMRYKVYSKCAKKSQPCLARLWERRETWTPVYSLLTLGHVRNWLSTTSSDMLAITILSFFPLRRIRFQLLSIQTLCKGRANFAKACGAVKSQATVFALPKERTDPKCPINYFIFFYLLPCASWLWMNIKLLLMHTDFPIVTDLTKACQDLVDAGDA